MEEIKRPLCDSPLLVRDPGARVVVAVTSVVGVIEETMVLFSVEDCSDVKGLVLKLVCAADDTIASESLSICERKNRRAGTHSTLCANPWWSEAWNRFELKFHGKFNRGLRENMVELLVEAVTSNEAEFEAVVFAGVVGADEGNPGRWYCLFRLHYEK